jgi:anti-sigma-K factor RskA
MIVRSHAKWDKLAAGYALHALSPDDEQEFLLHSAECDTCGETVVTDALVTEQLAGLVPRAVPPPELRERVLAVTRDTPRRPAAHARPTSWRPPAWLGAAAAVLVVALGVNLASRPTEAPSTPAGALRACAVDDGCRSFSLVAVGDDRTLGALVVRGTSSQLVVDGLEPNDVASTTYVLWQKAGRGPVLALAAFDVHEESTVVRRELRAPLDKTDWLAVSIEKGRAAPPAPSVPVALALVAGR